MKQNLPMGVMNVVSDFDSSVRGICQNPDLAFNLENILLPDSFTKLSSTEDIGWGSCLTASFSCVRSAQILTKPLGLGTATIAEHQLVGSVTGEITPLFSMSPISFSTFGFNG